MSAKYVHTCIRVRDPDASVRFYNALGFEPRGRLNFSSAYNLYMGLPGDGDVLELTVNVGHDEPYDLGAGYNLLAISVDDILAALAALEPLGVQPEKPPFHPGDRDELPLIAFVADPDGYRIELIEGDFSTPQDPAG
jgi:lactoylglutathione lyase